MALDFLSPHALKLAEHTFTSYVVTVPQRIAFEATLVPSFWRNIQERLRVGDQIRLRAEDNSWIADVLVAAKSGVGVRIETLPGFPIRLDGAWKQAADTGHYYVNFLPNTKRYGVIRHEDAALVHDAETADLAKAWAKDTGLKMETPEAYAARIAKQRKEAAA